MSGTFRQSRTKGVKVIQRSGGKERWRESESGGHGGCSYRLVYSFIQRAHLSISDARRSFDEYFELNACYYRYSTKLPMLGEGDYGTFGSILPLSCLAAGAGERLGLCLSIRLHRSGYRTHLLVLPRACGHTHAQLPPSVTFSCRWPWLRP